MKALTLTKIKVPLELQDRPELTPGAGQVVVAIRSAALNRRDYWITQGQYPGIDPPVVLGSDGAGVVTNLGKGVDPKWMDRKVVIDPGMDWGDDPKAQSSRFSILGLPQDGTFSTEVLVDARQLHDRPSHLDWHSAAALPLAGVTAYRALFTQGGLQRGQNLLITGIGGGVATFALQYALAAGAPVWVTSSSQQKIDRAVGMGAQGGVNYKSDDWSKQLKSMGCLPNVIIDSAGGKGYGDLLGLAAPGATVVNYGATAGPPEKVDLFKVFWKQLRLQGSTMGSPEDFAAMIRFVNENAIVPIVDAVFALDLGNEAIASMQTSPQFGKIVLDVSGDGA